MPRLSVEGLARLAPLELEFGDLTVLVGPQATGKSLLLQLFKLLHDVRAVKSTLKRYAVLTENPDLLAEAYFGEGYAPLLQDIHVVWNGELVDFGGGRERKERVFYLPAQRALVFHQASWPRPFSDYRRGDPYVVRTFSERLRLLLESGLGGEEGVVFPVKRRLHSTIRNRVAKEVFRGTALKVVTDRGLKRLMLETHEGERLPFLSWSAGQREFVPLLLGMYWLTPLGKIPRQSVQWVVVEEPEMGLHPAALEATLLLLLELLRRGYKVIVSTHSTVVLDLLFALDVLKKIPLEQSHVAFRELFNLSAGSHVRELGQVAHQSVYKVYYFDPYRSSAVEVRDITSLDPFAEDIAIAHWGGLTDFAGRVGDLIAKYS